MAELASVTQRPRWSLRRGIAIAMPLRWLLYLAPALVLTAIFVVYPALESFRLSFFSWPGYGPQEAVGFDNFRHLLSDAQFREALENTIVFTIVTAVVGTVVGVALAIALDRKIRGHKVFKALIFLPVILPTTFIGLAWANGFNPYFGWVDQILAIVNVHHSFLTDPSTVIYAIAFCSIMQMTGFPMIVVLSALGDVPRELHEAATLEGVTAWQRARYVMIPMVREVIATVFLLQLIWGFGNFEFVYVMTQGGPGTASEVTSTFVYREAFKNREFGYAAAAAVVTTILIGIVAVVYLTVFRPRRIARAG